MSGINCLLKQANAFFSGIIKISMLWSYCQTTSHYPTYVILWQCFLLSLSSHPRSFICRHRRIYRVFHLPIPTYIPTSTPPLPISLNKSSPSSMDVTIDTLLLVTTLTCLDDQPLCRNPSCDRHPPAWYCASAITTYSLEFLSFVSASILYRNLNLILRL